MPANPAQPSGRAAPPNVPAPPASDAAARPGTAPAGPSGPDSRLGIVHLYPTLMGTYGDAGNVAVLRHRAAGRGIGVEIVTVGPGDPVPALGDLYVIGGGEDHGQVVAARLLRQSGALAAAVTRGAAVFAVCAGLQVIGTDFEVAGGAIEPGLGLLDARTRRREPRAVGEVLADPDPALGLDFLTGYENHGGGTELGDGARPLARLRERPGGGHTGIGNGAGGPAGDGTEGAYAGHVLGTYLHGPVLARNPGLADLLLAWAAGRDLAPFAAPYVPELRAERAAYVTAGTLSPAAFDPAVPS
ncbi:MAG: glutamine amidotransferase [Bifidobacteriaceae bacterium]|nr:glutamine amidotransferase [Bifidobacteriaceae bacterium]